jgi:hypothetical protein
VILPALVTAVVKLRQRDLSPLLEGAGWAINARMLLTPKQSRYFTESPPFPPRSRGVRRRSRRAGGVLLFLGILFLVFLVAAPSLVDRGADPLEESSEPAAAE